MYQKPLRLDRILVILSIILALLKLTNLADMDWYVPLIPIALLFVPISFALLVILLAFLSIPFILLFVVIYELFEKILKLIKRRKS